jgi:hypothetical protein
MSFSAPDGVTQVPPEVGRLSGAPGGRDLVSAPFAGAVIGVGRWRGCPGPVYREEMADIDEVMRRSKAAGSVRDGRVKR